MRPEIKLRATITGFNVFLDSSCSRSERYRVEILHYRRHWQKFSEALLHCADLTDQHALVESTLHPLLIVQSAMVKRLLKSDEQADDASPSPCMARGQKKANKRDDGMEMG